MGVPVVIPLVEATGNMFVAVLCLSLRFVLVDFEGEPGVLDVRDVSREARVGIVEDFILFLGSDGTEGRPLVVEDFAPALQDFKRVWSLLDC